MSKHTPGPYCFTKFVGGDGRHGYAILSDNPEVGRGYGVMWVEEGEFPNAKHDGPLFAAATDLLEALKAARADLWLQIEGKHGPEAASRYPSLIKADAAIAKAEG